MIEDFKKLIEVIIPIDLASIDLTSLVINIAVTILVLGLLQFLLARSGRGLSLSLVVVFAMIAGAAMIAQLPYWILLEALLFLLVGLGVLRLRNGLKKNRDLVAPSVVLILMSASAMALLWIRAGTPLWRYLVFCLLLAVAGLLVFIQRRSIGKATRSAITPEMTSSTTPEVASSTRRRKYLYWSQRGIDAAAESYGMRLQVQTEYTFKSPTVALLPEAGMTINRQLTRHQVANRLLKAVGSIPRYDGALPAPSSEARGFIEGAGTIAFSEFRGSEEFELGQMAISFTALETSDNILVAICLFCSMDNFAGFIQDSTGPFLGRWTFSSSPAIAKFIRSYGRDKSYFSDQELAAEAVKIALDDRDVGEQERGPWKRRPLTFAEVQGEAEFLAEIYHEVWFDSPTEIFASGHPKFHRILVGAPLWITTSAIRAVRISDEYSESEIDQDGPQSTN